MKLSASEFKEQMRVSRELQKHLEECTCRTGCLSNLALVGQGYNLKESRRDLHYTLKGFDIYINIEKHNPKDPVIATPIRKAVEALPKRSNLPTEQQAKLDEKVKQAKKNVREAIQHLEQMDIEG